MVMDNFTALVLCIITLLVFFIVYPFTYISRYTAESNFYSLFCLMDAGMNGVVMSGDLFNIFVFLEIAAISSYALVAFGVEREQLEATFKYQVLGGLASLLILFAIGLVYWKAKTLNIADVKTAMGNSPDKVHYMLIQLLFLCGFGLKAAVIPFHACCPMLILTSVSISAIFPCPDKGNGELVYEIFFKHVLSAMNLQFEYHPCALSW
jgi:multicomponent Na+:H+ antiporter subunit D